MADGFITRRGGGASQFYEGTVELSAYWTEGITFDVGFKPQNICITRANSGANQTYYILMIHIAYDASGTAKTQLARVGANRIEDENAWLTHSSEMPTIERTSTGVKITGTDSKMFSGTYRVIATA